MYLKFFLKFIFFTALAIVQIGFVSGLPVWARELNLVIIAMVFFLEFGAGRGVFWWLMLVGFLFDLYHPLFFGFFTVFWPIVFLLAEFLSANFFTNRSLYSFLGLFFFTNLFYYFFLNLALYFVNFFSGGRAEFFLLAKDFWLKLGTGTALNLLAAVILFNFVSLANDKLKPVFIIRK
jgi:hypothetical protein